MNTYRVSAYQFEVGHMGHIFETP